MRVLRQHRNVPDGFRGASVAIGNFDGVHLGHQAVIAEAGRVARAEGAPFGVLTFEPHPRRYFRPDLPPFRLTPFRNKAHYIESLGVDALFVERFDEKLASLPAEDFVDRILVAGLGVRHVVVGYDFVFGKDRRGDPDLLLKRAKVAGFGLTCLPPVKGSEGVVYSATRIREHLIAGNPVAAAELLGRHWEIEGRVEHGDARGRTLGFPTANLRLRRHLCPAEGVYAVRVAIERRHALALCDGVANFGFRPTIGGGQKLFEVHLFDFTGDLYGAHLRISLVDFLRGERKFDGLEALKAQIAEDSAQARFILARSRKQDQDASKRKQTFL